MNRKTKEREREALNFNPAFINYTSLLLTPPVNKAHEKRERILKAYLSYCIRKLTIGAASYLSL